MRVDLCALLHDLQEAKEGTSYEVKAVSDYVLQHIYEPLAHDGILLFADLDFDAFTPDDLHALQSRLEEEDRTIDHFRRLNLHFCEASPVSRAGRSFC